MQTRAIKAVFENGNIKLLEKPPLNLENLEVTVLFKINQEPKEKFMSKEESLRILKKYSGTLRGDFDYEKERDEWLEEKYGLIN